MPTAQKQGYSQEVFLVDALPALPAGEAFLGQIGHGGAVVSATPVTDTSAMDAGDVWFPATALANAVRVSGGRAEITSITILDEDDQTAAACVVYFFASNVGVGVSGSAPGVTDANMRDCLGYVSFANTDFLDVGGAKFASKSNINLMVAPTTGTTIYVSATTAGTGQYTASGVKVKVGFRYH